MAKIMATSELMTMRTSMAPVAIGRDRGRRTKGWRGTLPQDICHQLKEFKEGDDSEKSSGKEEKVLLGEAHLPDIFRRELMETG